MSNLNEKNNIFDRVPFIDAIGSSYMPDQILRNPLFRISNISGWGELLDKMSAELRELNVLFSERHDALVAAASYISENGMDCFQPTDEEAKIFIESFKEKTIELDNRLSEVFSTPESVVGFANYFPGIYIPMEFCRYIARTIAMNDENLKIIGESALTTRLSDFFINKTIFGEEFKKALDESGESRPRFIAGFFHELERNPSAALEYSGVSKTKELGEVNPIGEMVTNFSKLGIMNDSPIERRELVYKVVDHASLGFVTQVACHGERTHEYQMFNALHLQAMSPYLTEYEKEPINKCAKPVFTALQSDKVKAMINGITSKRTA